MNVRRLLWVALGFFLAIVLVAIGISARFTLSNITANPYGFIEDFFSQWSPALSAAGAIIVAIMALWAIYESRRAQEREKEQALCALHDEIYSNSRVVAATVFGISVEEALAKEGGTKKADMDMPYQLIETSAFDAMKNAGQLNWLVDTRENIVDFYSLIKQ